MATTEKNILIAEFMGGTHKTVTFTTPYGEESYEEWEGVEGIPPSTGWAVVSSGIYPYHTSWDWLMPVVERLNEVANCSLVELHKAITSVNIKWAVDCVVAAIQWYNKQPKI